MSIRPVGLVLYIVHFCKHANWMCLYKDLKFWVLPKSRDRDHIFRDQIQIIISVPLRAFCQNLKNQMEKQQFYLLN